MGPDALRSFVAWLRRPSASQSVSLREHQTQAQRYLTGELQLLPMRVEQLLGPILPIRKAKPEPLVRLSIAAFPVILYIANLAFGSGCNLRSLGPLSWYAVTLYIAVVGFNGTLRGFERLGWRIWELLGSDPRRQEVRRFTLNWLHPSRELPLSIVAGCAGLIVTDMVRPQLSTTVGFCSASYLSVALTAIVVVLGGYYAIGLALTVRKIAASPDLKASWIDPLRTPAIMGLSHLLAKATFSASVGGLAMATPLIVAYALSPGASSAVRLLTILFAVMGLMLLGVIAIPPQVWLSHTVDRHRNRALLSLANRIDRLATSRESPDKWRHIHDISGVYRAVLASPSSTLSKVPLIEYSSAVIAALLPLMVDLVAATI